MSANPAWPEGVGRRVLAEVDSTNAEAARIAASLTGPCWVLALRQTEARGRRGRPWSTPEGNFAATLIMRPSETPDRVALRSFVASLALYDAFVSATGQNAPFTLKWPNDVLLNGGKVAGILLESSGQGGVVSYISIGIGINLAVAPAADKIEPGALRPVTVQEETGARIAPEDFLDHLAAAYARREAQFVTYGFAPIREAWLARAARLGEKITARTMSETIEGIFETVDDTGALILTSGKGRHAIPAADVFF